MIFQIWIEICLGQIYHQNGWIAAVDYRKDNYNDKHNKT